MGPEAAPVPHICTHGAEEAGGLHTMLLAVARFSMETSVLHGRSVLVTLEEDMVSSGCESAPTLTPTIPGKSQERTRPTSQKQPSDACEGAGVTVHATPVLLKLLNAQGSWISLTRDSRKWSICPWRH